MYACGRRDVFQIQATLPNQIFVIIKSFIFVCLFYLLMTLMKPMIQSARTSVTKLVQVWVSEKIIFVVQI